MKTAVACPKTPDWRQSLDGLLHSVPGLDRVAVEAQESEHPALFGRHLRERRPEFELAVDALADPGLVVRMTRDDFLDEAGHMTRTCKSDGHGRRRISRIGWINYFLSVTYR